MEKIKNINANINPNKMSGLIKNLHIKSEFDGKSKTEWAVVKIPEYIGIIGWIDESNGCYHYHNGMIA